MITKQQPLMVDSNDSTSLNCTCLSVSVMPCKAIPEPFLPVFTGVSVSRLQSHSSSEAHSPPAADLSVRVLRERRYKVGFILLVHPRTVIINSPLVASRFGASVFKTANLRNAEVVASSNQTLVSS